MPNMLTPAIALLILVASGCLCGCEKRGTEADTRWTSLGVRYCVGEGPDVREKEWFTKDPALLNSLSTAIANRSEMKRLSLIGTMRTNRLCVNRADGSRLEIYILSEKGFISVHDPDSPHDSASMSVSSEFSGKLKNAIRSSTGEEPHFVYNTEVNVLDGTPDGAAAASPVRGDRQ